MSATDDDLLSTANARSRFGNTRRPGANREDPMPGPREFNLPYHRRTDIDSHDSSEFDESEDRSSISWRAGSSIRHSSFATDSTNSEDIGETLERVDIAQGQRLVIAIDYGTTFTGVAIVLVPVDENATQLKDIIVLRDWHNSYNEEKVPSVFSYAKPNAKDQQWGNSFSEDAELMVYTKLELDAQESKLDELDMILDNLDGMHDLRSDYVVSSLGNPSFTPKKPELVVLDYMKKVFERVWAYLRKYPSELLLSLPVDIIITHPVVWSYRAKNATYRAVTLAGFNKDTFPELDNIKLLAEPEAAAVYTARYLKEEEVNENVLQKNDTFVLCDAGGGTVDVVTFQVVETEPTLELQQIGEPHSRKCGSVFIDGKFKEWLRDSVLGPDKYELLEPNTRKRIKPHSTTGKKMRDIMKTFIERKRSFKGTEEADHRFTIEMPPEFRDLKVDGCLEEGLLTLDYEMMEFLFEECVDQIVDLINKQSNEVMEQYDDQGVARIKTILMIGGFGESAYLQAIIRQEMGLNDITVHRPATSWSAVVRGAALYGVDKTRLKNYVTTKRFPDYYAVARDIEEPQGNGLGQYQDQITGRLMGKNRLTWIVHRGDLALEDYTQSQETLLAFNFRENHAKDFTISIYKYLPKDNILPTRVRTRDPELAIALTIPISFAEKFNQNPEDFEMYKGVGGRESYYQGVVSLYLTWKNESLEATVVWNKEVIYPVTEIKS